MQFSLLKVLVDYERILTGKNLMKTANISLTFFTELQMGRIKVFEIRKQAVLISKINANCSYGKTL